MRGSEFTNTWALGSQENKHINAPSLELSSLSNVHNGQSFKVSCLIGHGQCLVFRPWEHAVPVDKVLFLSCIVRCSSWRGSCDLKSLMGRREAENSQGIVSLRLSYSSNSKESACDAGDQGLIPGLGSTSGEGNGNPLQYSCLENCINREACWATVHGVAKSWTQLSD